VRGRHAARFLALAEEAAPHILRIERRTWLGRIEREHDNLRAAFDFCAGSGRIAEALRLAGALWRFWQFRGHLREGLQRVRRVLDDPASRAHPVEREAALEAAGGLAYWLADMVATTAAYQEALALARANADPARISNALYNLSFLEVWGKQSGRSTEERMQQADAELDEAVALARQAADRAGIARCLWSRSNNLAYLRNDYVAALVPLAEAIAIFREIGDHFGLAWALHSEGIARLHTGEFAASRAAFDEQVTLLGEARDPSGTAIALANQAQLAVAEGDLLRAFRLSGASAALRHLTGAELVSKVDAVEGRVIEATPEYEGARDEGLAMNFDQAVAFALRRS